MSALLVLGLSGLTAVSADGAPTQNLATVQKQVDALRDQAEVAAERYNATRESLASVKLRLAAARDQEVRQRAVLQASRRALGEAARELYKAGDLATLSLVLGDDPDGTLAAGSLLSSVASRRSDAVARFVLEQRRLTEAVADVESQRQRLVAQEQQLATSRKEIKAKLTAADALLSRLSSGQRARLAAASRSSERTALERAGVSGAVASGGHLDCADVTISAPNARVAAVLQYACAQLGDPYQWGQDGPGSFDCSGLVMAAWARGGVSLPHNAEQQAGFGRRVSTDNLLPGDIVFFHSPISHDGLYIGRGLMIHAPQSGDVVRIAPLYSRVTAAVRL